MQDPSKITQQIKGLLKHGAGRNTIVERVQLDNEVNELDVKLRLTEYDLKSRRAGCTHLAFGCGQILLGLFFGIGFIDAIPGILAFLLSVLVITGAAECGYAVRQIFYGIYKGSFFVQALPVLAAFMIMVLGFFFWRAIGGTKSSQITAYEFVNRAFFK